MHHHIFHLNYNTAPFFTIFRMSDDELSSFDNVDDLYMEISSPSAAVTRQTTETELEQAVASIQAIGTNIIHSTPISSNRRVTRSLSKSASLQDQGSDATNDAATSYSTPLEKSSQSSFRTMPELSTLFDKEHYNSSRNYINKCKSCDYKNSSNEINRLLAHIKNCPGIADEIKEQFMNKTKAASSVATSYKKDKKVGLLIATMIISDNLPIKFAESSTFLALLNHLRPDVHYPSRREVGRILIPHLADHYNANFQKNLESGVHYQLSIEFDHWTELTQKSLLAVIATQLDGSRHLVDLEDCTSVRGTAENIYNQLIKAITDIDPLCINSFISDSAEPCKKARSKLTSNSCYSHTIEHRCFAHFLNSIGGAFTLNKEVEDLMSWATKLVSFITSCKTVRSELRARGFGKLQKSTSTRWYSKVGMLDSLLKVKDPAIELLSGLSDAEREGVLRCPEFWNDLEPALAVLRPLANCIALAERSDGSLGESVRALLEYCSSLFQADWNNPFIMAGIESILNYFSPKKLKDELGVMLSAYALDRSNNLNYLTNEGKCLVCNFLVRLAYKSKFKHNFVYQILPDEFEQFCTQTGVHSRPQPTNQKSYDWWNSQPDTGILRRLGMRLGNLKSSSANTERLFSVMKLIQGHSKTNFKLETFLNIARCKTAMANPTADTEIREMLSNFRLNDNSDEDEDEIESQRTILKRTNRLSQKVRPTTISLDRVVPLNYCPEILSSDELKVSYEHFVKLIDFSLINQTVNEESDEEMFNDEDVDVVVKRFSSRLNAGEGDIQDQ